MRVLFLNICDLPGRRFNGYDLMAALEKKGVESRMMVWEKYSDNESRSEDIRSSTIQGIGQGLGEEDGKAAIAPIHPISSSNLHLAYDGLSKVRYCTLPYCSKFVFLDHNDAQHHKSKADPMDAS